MLASLAATSCTSIAAAPHDAAVPAPTVEPPPPVSPGVAVTELALGAGRSCALLVGGSVKCWGARLGGDGHVLWPTLLEGVSGVTQLALGESHACALLASGRVRCFGHNEHGALGDGTHQPAVFPNVDPGVDGVAQLALGSDFTCARKATGAVTCWGYNQQGSLATGALTLEELRPVSTKLEGVRHLAVARWHGVAARADGTIVTWGDRPGAAPVAAPTAWPNLSHVVEVGASSTHTCVRTDDGRVFCWGDNDKGQIGDPSAPPFQPHPRQVVEVVDAVQLAVATGITCVRHVDGAVSCFGANDQGQLGDGTTVSRPRPTRVPGLVGARFVASSGRHTCVALAHGEAQCWGSNADGELGDRTRSPRAVRGPVLF